VEKPTDSTRTGAHGAAVERDLDPQSLRAQVRQRSGISDEIGRIGPARRPGARGKKRVQRNDDKQLWLEIGQRQLRRLGARRRPLVIRHDEDLLAACVSFLSGRRAIGVRAAVMRDHRTHHLARKSCAHLAGQAGEDEQGDDQFPEHGKSLSSASSLRLWHGPWSGLRQLSVLFREPPARELGAHLAF